MIEKIWFENHYIKFILWPLLWPLSQLFKLVSHHRRRQFLNDRSQRYKAPVPVIVVGNITAGGNGKTPVVIWLVEKLIQQNLKPGVVSRGYGGKSDHYPLRVTNDTDTKACGDEPKLIFKRTGVPVVVDPVRTNAVKALLEQNVDVIVTDDGLQHYALDRDIELVVVDGHRRYGNQSFIPLGPLREGMERLNSVDFIINNGGKIQDNELAMQLAPELAVNLLTGEQRPVDQLKEVVAFAGIGHPKRFFNTLAALGADVIKTQGFADHQDLRASDLEQLQGAGQHLIMTEKDAVKCSSYAKENWWYLPVSASFSEQDEQKIMNTIIKVRKEYGSPSA